ncbi:outer membrane protein assembly factor BamA [Pseudoruegeria aquimaris]|nr:outer membrane protein assembly factor BamA [Pseudoruegeria aquimaris]
MFVFLLVPGGASAQTYQFNTIQVEGNQRIESATIQTYAGIAAGQPVDVAQLNDAYQRILASGLFETVVIEPRGGTLYIEVEEYPTINRISIEGNKRLKDEDLLNVVSSQPRRVYSPATVEADAQLLAQAYNIAGRSAASVTPKIIKRSDNRVDVVFEIAEGGVSEIERLSFVGNRAFSDRRLRRVLETKQAGYLRRFIRADSFVQDRLEVDKQLLTDFYQSRGFVDFQVLSVTSEVSRERDGYFVTFNIREGQSFKIGEVTVVSDLPEVDAAAFVGANKLRTGQTYSPTRVDNSVRRLENKALQDGLNFIRVDPRITRNDRDLTLDIELALVRGPRIFVERIDIEGNTTTLDRVIRRQFKTVEGDPFNPREIRESAERIRALGFFEEAEVNTREGTASDRVIVDVDVVEQPTGSLTLGASYGIDSGLGLTLGFSESNFLGRGQFFSLQVGSGSDNVSSAFRFSEPALLGRDLALGLSAFYKETNYDNAFYDTLSLGISPDITFPISENGRLSLRYQWSREDLSNVSADSSAILKAEEGSLDRSAIGYTYSYDSRRAGLNPNAGVVLRFRQDIAGFGGDARYLRTEALAGAETKILSEEVTVRAIFEGGMINMQKGTSRATDRFFLNRMRGFSTNGLGPRDLNAANEDALGGNMFALARFEADFPLGLPEEYGITGGLFMDVGSVWSLDNVAGGPQTGCTVADCTVDDSLNLRAVIGFALFWDTPIGPLRFNFTHALKKEVYDKDRSFDLTISTTF